MPDSKPQEPPKQTKKPTLNVILFLCTLCTVYLTGMLSLNAHTIEEAIFNGLEFVASLMGILVAHEAGHYVMARKNRVNASLPYFIPIPPVISMFGTLGAVIVMRGRIRSRNALMEVGAAGPLAGMAVAVPLLFLGLSTCPIGPIEPGSLMEGQSLLYLAAKQLAVGPIPEGYDIYINYSPMAFAGWFGMLVTMLNMLPIGQLDGGHVFYALFGDMHSKVSIFFHRLLFALGIGIILYLANDALAQGLEGEDFIMALMPGVSWMILGLFMVIMFRKRGFSHPPTDDSTLSFKHKVIGVICFLIFIVTFMPIVMRPVF